VVLPRIKGIHVFPSVEVSNANVESDFDST
jgi:hypothetical protein